MKPSLLFLPDISGFTEFVNTTEVAHSQHVIAEILEVLIDSNIQGLQLAEVEGDALFFYKEEEVPSLEMLLAQIETMYTAFYSHLKMLEKNRICPCNACATAPKLQLKIIAHCGKLQFINVQNKRKPFGTEVIQAHRLMKNSVNSDNYVLVSKSLSDHIMLPVSYKSKLFDFEEGKDEYDNQEIEYLFSIIDKENLKIKPFSQAANVEFSHPPSLTFSKEFPISAHELMELISNYQYRYHWVEGVDRFEFNEHEVTRIGTEHVCVINGKHFDFITVTKEVEPGQLVYGELSTSPNPIGEFYQFFIITPKTKRSCLLDLEVYVKPKSILGKILYQLVGKRQFLKNNGKAIEQLHRFASNQNN
ncbi:MAG: DUF2652 domain-containing protein [Cyanothece sp. SIO1E1]|nr:DUF2652 domain-containing protein [Cyanothece sp. SIO1E1]